MDTKISHPAIPTNQTSDIMVEMVMFDALYQICKLTGYNKEQMLIMLIKVAQDWVAENITFH